MSTLSIVLNKRVTIQAQGSTQNDMGEIVAGWTDVATVWANVVDVSGREYLASQAAQNAVQTKITIRYLAGVAPAMRVTHGANIYNIEAVLGQDNRTLLLMCSRGPL